MRISVLKTISFALLGMQLLAMGIIVAWSIALIVMGTTFAAAMYGTTIQVLGVLTAGSFLLSGFIHWRLLNNAEIDIYEESYAMA